MILHELATNSVKYGALSVPDGLLDVAGETGNDETIIVWTERGGPACVAPASTSGFGNKFLNRIVASQFGGSITYEWPEAGARATLRLKTDRIAI